MNRHADKGRKLPRGRTIMVGGVPIGAGRDLVIMAGPCAVENREQIANTVERLAHLGIPIIRGGAFKPRTSPYSFQGLGEKGLKILSEYAGQYGLRIVTEVMDTEHLELVARYAHMIQVGARSMYNSSLLRALGEMDLPVLLKRGFSSTITEFLSAADYIARGGNDRILLCERGIRTFETSTRFTLDISSVPVLKRLSDLPVVVDPSHAAGDRALVPALAMAAVAAGADGLLIEAHPEPENALCDSGQALDLEQLERLVPRLYRVRAAAFEGEEPLGQQPSDQAPAAHEQRL